MLTADLVHVRRYKDELRLVRLDAAARERALGLAESYLAIAQAHIGKTREEYEEAVDAVAVEPRDRRLGAGLRKLVEDRLLFDVAEGVAPEALRRDVFLRAAALRRSLDGSDPEAFSRTAVLEAVAQEHGLTTTTLEQALYADLRSAHVLQQVEPISAGRLVDGYDQAQAQAVLLRAIRVRVDLSGATPGAYRALFRKLKFLRLLHTIHKNNEAGGYRIEIDGPYSLFDSVTKYGLQLALALPALMACGHYHLDAALRWGKERQPLRLQLAGGEVAAASQTDQAETDASLPDEVAALVRGIRDLATPWSVRPATALLELPGIGLCVPDLRFHDPSSGRSVYLEVLGFWSRDAVWRRVELVEQGLGARILFAVSDHLRVSEAALGMELPGALYVYKRVMNPRAVLQRIEQLARRDS